jgi:DNA replication protein DnaC
MTDTEPTKVGDHLMAAAAALRAKAPATAPPPPVIPGMAEARRDGKRELLAELWAATIPRRFQGARIGDLAEPAAGDLQDWADGPDGRNLLLLGPVGTGKTHAAVAACRPLHARGMRVRFLPVVELLDLLRPGGPDGVWDELVGCDVLVLDDLGTERPTDWTAERMGALVNRRWLEERPMVVTTNLLPAELEEAVGARTYSRLADHAVALRLTGDDRRRARA